MMKRVGGGEDGDEGRGGAQEERWLRSERE